MESTNEKNKTEKNKTERVLTSKQTGERITIDALADIKNKSAMLKSSSGRKNSYDYAKCAKNLEDLNEIMNLGLTAAEISDIQKNIKEFCEEKTKISFSKNKLYSEVKKAIRKFIQNFQKTDCPYSLTEQAIIKSLCQ